MDVKYTRMYGDKDDPRMGILSAAEFAIFSIQDIIKGYTMGQFIFFHYIIHLIKHNTDWELIRQLNQMQLNHDNKRKILKG